MTPPTQLLETLNRATRAELIALPRIGPALADRIIAARPFASLADCAARVPGISENTLQALQERATPISAAEAHAAPAAENDSSAPPSLQNPAASPATPPDETPLEQRFEEIRTRFEKELQEQSQQARERIETLTAALNQRAAKTVTWGTLLWSNLITLAIGLLLALAFLAVFNARLQNRLTTLSDAQSAQIEILRADLTNLQGRIDALETIGARTAALESAQQEMTQSFAEIQDGFEQLQQTVNDLQETVAAQSQATARFSNFLQQLQALLNQTFSDSSQPEGAQ